MSNDFWPDVATIDNKPGCKGCFTRTSRRTYPDESNTNNVDTECKWTQSKCGCPDCPIFCNSKIIITSHNGQPYSGGEVFTAEEQVPGDLDCIEWYLKESCETC